MMEIRESLENGAHVIALIGSAEDAQLSEMDSLLESLGSKRVILDLSRLDYLNSQGISVLLMAWRRARRESGRFVLAAPRGAVRKLFEITRLSSFILTRDTLEEALSLVSPPPADSKVKGPA